MTSLPKNPTEGDKIDCPGCGVGLIARLKTYNDNKYPAYVQWQNKDETKSHLDQSGNCHTNITETPKPQQSTIAENITTCKIPEFSKETISMIEGETLTIYMIRNTVNKFLKKFEDEPHGGMVGQFTELIFDKHFKVVFKKASEIKD